MADQNHYEVLEISPTATQADIKRAYRRLAKKFHPDSNHSMASHEHIAIINAAYEVLGDPNQRRSYDTYLNGTYTYRRSTASATRSSSRHPRSETQKPRRPRRTSGRDADEAVNQWLQFVYRPVCQTLSQILSAFDQEIDALSADPFDDDLIEDFQRYLDQSRASLVKAQSIFRTQPNPSSLAKAASNLYHCLSQVGDGIDELERFITSYDDYYLHTGHELFRIAQALKQDAQADLNYIL
jgi:molecular chaperone DnaJ